ncbi:DUF6056 family protein [Caproiciproducens sp.]
MREKTIHWKRGVLYIPFLAALVFWLIIYSHTFLQGDDYRFANNGGSLPKIWRHYLEYYTYGGARMGNLLAGVFLMMDLRVWKVTTAFAAAALSLIFFYYIVGSLRPEKIHDRRIMLSACVCAVFPGLLPMSSQLFSDSFLWLDGSTNYLYPFLLMMVGFLPFYNRLRGRALPKIFLWLSPVCFVAAALLHEQVTMMLLCMCVSALFYLGKNKKEKIPLCLKVLTAINAAALILMLTAPGAYSRVQQENGAEQGAITNFARNFKYYLVPLVNDYWPWLVAMGLAAVFLLSRLNRGKSGKLIQLYLCFGALLIPLSWSLRFPMLQLPEMPVPLKVHSQSRFQLLAEGLLTLYWLLYILLIFVALLVFAREKEPDEGRSRCYLPVLYVGMWASQAIPAVAAPSSGRARMPLYAFVLLTIFCILYDYGVSIRWAGLLRGSLALIGIVSFACIARGTAINGIAFGKIEQQLLKAQNGRLSTVLIDYNQFDWTFCNATFSFKPDKSADGYETAIRKYYRLPDSVTVEYTKAKTGHGVKSYPLG